MKAVCVLVCLALAQGISASIFKQSHGPLDDLLLPLEYINKYQQPLYQPQERTYEEYIGGQKQQQKQQQKKQQQKQKKHLGSEYVSHESSQESNERTKLQQSVTLGSTEQKWTAPLFAAVMKVQKEVGATPFAKNIIMWPPGLHPMPVQKKQKQPTIAEQQVIQKIFGEAAQAMKRPTEEEKIKFHEAFAAAAETHNEDDHLNATQLLQKNQYGVEEHTVKTDDGYFLTLFRIPSKKQNSRDVSKKPAVFLMHGLLGSADDWLLMGPGKSLAYLLSDAGYDVWLGNARGNKYSRQHVTKHPALSDFWQFSNDEVALHDLPAMIDYVLETSAQEKLYFVGHSQGTTAFFALAAAHPEYNDKIIMMHALAPMVYMTHTRSPLIRMIAPYSPFEASLHHEIGHGAFTPSKELIATVGGSMLQNVIGCKNVSNNMDFVMSGVNIENLNPELAQVIMRHVPAGTSAKVIKHYGQQVTSEDFRKYDFGPTINKKVYGSFEPPKYDLENVKASVTLYFAQEDWLAHPTDVAKLQQILPNAVTPVKVPQEHFSNMDFQFSPNAPELVYKQLIQSMNGVNSGSDSNDNSNSNNSSSDNETNNY